MTHRGSSLRRSRKKAKFILASDFECVYSLRVAYRMNFVGVESDAE